MLGGIQYRWTHNPNNTKQQRLLLSSQIIMHPTLARRALGNLVPPKIATPSSVVSKIK